jgi:hypothetical protein
MAVLVRARKIARHIKARARLLVLQKEAVAMRRFGGFIPEGMIGDSSSLF